MKKLLIIGHFWPYRGGGSYRMLGLAKYLREFDWQPIIITGSLEKKPDFNVRYEEINYPSFFGFKTKRDIGDELKEKSESLPSGIRLYLLKPLFNFAREFIAYPDEHKYWKSFAIKEAGKILKEEKIDALMSILPVTAHLIAKELKENHKVPWIADFPDLWSQNYYYHYGSIRKILDRKLELKTISSADAITTISQPMAELLKALHKNREVYVINHGFDPEEVNDPPIKLADKFTITYTGQIYTGKQDPLKLLIALKELIKDRVINPKDIDVRFYGPERIWLKKEIENFELADIVKQHKMITREIALEKQRESQILLSLKWEDSKSRGIYTGKIFEYLSARRPIIAIGGANDVITELLKETKAGIDAQTIEDIKNTLKKLYLEYKSKGRVVYNGNIETVNKFSWREMARKFSDLLNLLLHEK